MVVCFESPRWQTHDASCGIGFSPRSFDEDLRFGGSGCLRSRPADVDRTSPTLLARVARLPWQGW